MRKLTQKQLDNLRLGRVKGIKRPSLQGRILSEAIKKKISQTSKGKHYSPKTEWKKGFIPFGSILFKKGQKSWNKGKVYSTNKFLKENINKYKSLHKRINRKFIKVGFCEKCHKYKKTE